MNLTQVHYLTQWNTAMPPILDRLLVEHMNDMESKLEEILWIARQNCPSQHQEFSETIQKMTPACKQKMLLTPLIYQYISNFLLESSEQNLGYLIKAYADEIAIEESIPGQAPIWSAMADRLLPPRTNEAPDSKIVFMSKIDDCIVVDFESPEVQKIELSSGVLNEPFDPLTDEEKSAVLEKLDTALKNIDEVSLAAGRLVRNYTRIIRIRKSNNNRTSSEQVPREIGTIRLLNVQMEQFRLIDLMDNLIHEATHNFLSCFEGRYGSFVAFNSSPQVRPVSPWSGNPIPYSAFTHAVVIYFSLFNFMRCAHQLYSTAEKACPDITLMEIREKIDYCSKGFRLQVPLERYLTIVGESNPYLMQVYRLFQSHVQSFYR